MIDEYFDRDGLPLAIQEFGHLCRDWSYRVVGKDSTPNGDISTVWLGMEHGFVNGRPVIFETMVFGGVFDQAQERYCTDAEAREGHARWLAKVQATPEWPMALRLVVTCAKCGLEGVARSDDKVEAQGYFDKRGWALTAEGTICPYCAPELEDVP